MNMTLDETYRSILAAAAMRADAEGYVSFDNELYANLPNQPVVINEKRLVLPTTEHLRNPSKAKVLFHPLREQAMQGESEVVARLRRALGLRLNFAFSAMLNELLIICKNVANHKHLNPDQLSLVTIGQNVTEDTHIALTELLKRAESQKEVHKSFISIYVKKNALLHGTNYHRAGVASFPIYEALASEEEKPLGMTINKRERKNLLALMEYILPDIDKEHAYDRGSNSGVAPYLEGLMKVFGAIASRLNDKYELFAEIINDKTIPIEAAWETAFEDLDKLLPEIQMIPTQPGNEGRQPVAETKKVGVLSPQALQSALNAPQPAAVPVAVQPQHQQYQQPVHHQPQQPQLEHTGNGVTWRSAASAMGMPSPDMYGGYRPGMVAHPGGPRSDWNSQFQPAPYQPVPYHQGYGGGYGGGYPTGRV